jgi:hypothetical protein
LEWLGNQNAWELFILDIGIWFNFSSFHYFWTYNYWASPEDSGFLTKYSPYSWSILILNIQKIPRSTKYRLDTNLCDNKNIVHIVAICPITSYFYFTTATWFQLDCHHCSAGWELNKSPWLFDTDCIGSISKACDTCSAQTIERRDLIDVLEESSLPCSESY